MSVLPAELGGAVLSPDGRYRYRLWRKLGSSPGRAVFIMLNPSTADAAADDPTIRRCVRFAVRERCGRLDVVNLYAWRDTDPMGLLTRTNDRIGPENDHHLYRAFAELAAHEGVAIAAWGAFSFAGHQDRVQSVLEIARRAGLERMRCLGVTRSDAPRHPLFVRGEAALRDWWRA